MVTCPCGRRRTAVCSEWKNTHRRHDSIVRASGASSGSSITSSGQVRRTCTCARSAKWQKERHIRPQRMDDKEAATVVVCILPAGRHNGKPAGRTISSAPVAPRAHLSGRPRRPAEVEVEAEGHSTRAARQRPPGRLVAQAAASAEARMRCAAAASPPGRRPGRRRARQVNETRRRGASASGRRALGNSAPLAAVLLSLARSLARRSLFPSPTGALAERAPSGHLRERIEPFSEASKTRA